MIEKFAPLVISTIFTYLVNILHYDISEISKNAIVASIAIFATLITHKGILAYINTEVNVGFKKIKKTRRYEKHVL